MCGSLSQATAQKTFDLLEAVCSRNGLRKVIQLCRILGVRKRRFSVTRREGQLTYGSGPAWQRNDRSARQNIDVIARKIIRSLFSAAWQMSLNGEFHELVGIAVS